MTPKTQIYTKLSQAASVSQKIPKQDLLKEHDAAKDSSCAAWSSITSNTQQVCQGTKPHHNTITCALNLDLTVGATIVLETALPYMHHNYKLHDTDTETCDELYSF